MSNGKVSQGKKIKSALERLDILEGDVQRLFSAVNESSMVARQGTAELASLLEAVVELLGAETVDAKVKEIAERKQLENLARAEAALAAGLEKGELVKADKVSEVSVIVGKEIDEKGEVIFPGKVQLQTSAIKPEFKEKLLGQGVGTVIDAPRGKFEVMAIYDVVAKPETPAEAAPAEAPAPTQPAATEATAAETVEQLESALKPVEA